MPSYFEEFEVEGQRVSAFHDSAGCINGEEHDWSGSRDNYECDHEEGEEHTDECGISSSESVCIKCEMGAMHHSMMTAE